MIVVSAKELTKAYGTDVILDKVSFAINGGDRVGIIGVNGAGKTTLLKMLTGEMSYESGEFFIAADTQIGYLKQDSGFNSEKTVIEEVENIFSHFPQMEKEMETLLAQIEENVEDHKLLERYDALQEKYKDLGGYTYKSEITGVLSSMAFKEDSYHKKISTLSGGERTRLALACLLLRKPDILFLDEPTNHLDIYMRRAVTEALSKYEGTILVVTHDRFLMQQLDCPIMNIEGGKGVFYENFEEFMAKHKSEGFNTKQPQPKAEKQDKPNNYSANQKEARRQAAADRLRMRECERDIERLQEEIDGYNADMQNPDITTDPAKMAELWQKLESANSQLDALYEEWAILGEKLEN